MKITLTFDSNDKEEMDAVLAILGASPIGKDEPKANITETPEDRKPPAEEEKKPTAVKASKDKPKVEEPPAEEEPETDELDADDELGPDDPEEETPSYTVDDVRKALKAFAAKMGKPAALKILKDHSAAAITEIKEEDYPSVMKAAALPDTAD